jgi:hypothetical protein
MAGFRTHRQGVVRVDDGEEPENLRAAGGHAERDIAVLGVGRGSEHTVRREGQTSFATLSAVNRRRPCGVLGQAGAPTNCSGAFPRRRECG